MFRSLLREMLRPQPLLLPLLLPTPAAARACNINRHGNKGACHRHAGCALMSTCMLTAETFCNAPCIMLGA